MDSTEIAACRSLATRCALAAARAAALALALAVASACAPLPPRNPLATWTPSPNHDARRPQLIVLHQTESASAAGALRVLRDARASYPVSAHYLIEESGRIDQLVPESARAWHAGASRWVGRADLNSASIGIELDNDGSEPFAEPQLAALLVLLEDLTTRWKIPREQVVGHGDVAPTRKSDPSALFPWARLAQAGFGLWPRAERAEPPGGFDPWVALRLVGYDLADPAAAVRAFHRHYRGSDADGLDGEDRAILYDLQVQLITPRPAR